jgi:hypothetical protein
MKVHNVHYVDNQELDDTERAIFATAYVMKLMRPTEYPPLPTAERMINGEVVGGTSPALACAAWAVTCFRADLKAR